MNQERLMQVLVEPQMTEKATRIGDKHRQYVFKVLRDATKPEIKAAVEKMFNVQVTGVQSLVVRPRTKQFRGRVGVRQGWKKAYITLKEGFNIDFLGAA
ncbi:MAG: 50S ribosomal protein L23 [Gammaproteobacteria bacterium]|nr:50S ribosomal protein L23 [Gammaproteobacteria bacterium]